MDPTHVYKLYARSEVIGQSVDDQAKSKNNLVLVQSNSIQVVQLNWIDSFRYFWDSIFVVGVLVLKKKTLWTKRSKSTINELDEAFQGGGIKNFQKKKKAIKFNENLFKWNSVGIKIIVMNILKYLEKEIELESLTHGQCFLVIPVA